MSLVSDGDFLIPVVILRISTFNKSKKTAQIYDFWY